MKIKITLTIALVITSFIISSCDKSTEPPVDNIKEYTWTIDTLINPHGYGVVPWSIWGSSSKDVWIAGFNLASQGEVFHWDGNKWNRVTPNLGFNYEAAAIIGFAEDNVYIAGYKIIADTALHSVSIILHYNYSEWQEEIIPIKGDALLYIHGRTSNDLWACGKYGSLYHKEGSIWQKMPFDKRKYLGLLSVEPDLGPIYVAPNGEVFLMNKYYNYKVYGDTAMFYFSKYSNNTWKDLDSCRLVNINSVPSGYKFGNKAMWGSNENEIYSVGNAIYKYNGHKWVIQIGGNPDYLDIKGTSANNVYTVGFHGTLRKFDGNEWWPIGGFSKYIVDFYAVMPFENDIFIAAHQTGIGYVVRGKVK
ncbi:MAG: hypothetical protein NTX22_09065 [Ignavibacteriales bacterium]|nr:hypothetical protein [Ignavibacteriales bacterium]